jgi:hypothetical protein
MVSYSKKITMEEVRVGQIRSKLPLETYFLRNNYFNNCINEPNKHNKKFGNDAVFDEKGDK